MSNDHNSFPDKRPSEEAEHAGLRDTLVNNSHDTLPTERRTPKIFLSWTIIRALATALTGIAILLGLLNGTTVLARVIGIGLLVSVATDFLSRQSARTRKPLEDTVTPKTRTTTPESEQKETAKRRKWGNPERIASFTFRLAGAVFLLGIPDATITWISIVLGIALSVQGIFNLRRGFRSETKKEDRSWKTLSGSFEFATGITVVILPDIFIGIIVLGVSVWWVAHGATVAIRLFSRQNHRTNDFLTIDTLADLKNMLMHSLQAHEHDENTRQALAGKLFYTGPNRDSRLRRFAALMALSVTIATFGVITDSTAVVIGAMLIAPLMTPLMAVAAALVLGKPRLALWSGIIALAGIGGGIILSTVLSAWVTRSPDSVLQNAEILSRTSPTLLDLLIALAAGAAGAFALSRPDVSDSLPGVAIAVALVPPLTVIGVTWQAGELSMAFGAFLLFLTNCVAIVLVASGTFILLGIAPLSRLQQEQRLIQMSFAALGTGTLIVAIPLAITGHDILTEQYARKETEATVKAWLNDGNKAEELRVTDIKIDRKSVNVQLTGSPPSPSVKQLASMLADKFDRSLEVEVRVLVEEHQKSEASPPD